MPRANLIAVLLLLSGEALAHPGHGAGGWLSATLSHLLGEPDHLTLILFPLVLGVAWLLRRALRARARQRASTRASLPSVR
jgi:hypothetical protein